MKYYLNTLLWGVTFEIYAVMEWLSVYNWSLFFKSFYNKNAKYLNRTAPGSCVSSQNRFSWGWPFDILKHFFHFVFTRSTIFHWFQSLCVRWWWRVRHKFRWKNSSWPGHVRVWWEMSSRFLLSRQVPYLAPVHQCQRN